MPENGSTDPFPPLSKDDPATLGEAWITKGDVARETFDYDAAIAAYDRADGLLAKSGANDLLYRARTGLAYAGTTVDPAHVSAQLGALLADPAFTKSASKAVLAQVEDLKARADINLGDKKTANQLVIRAVADSGGLTTEKVSREQVEIRADAGIISRLIGDYEETRRYFAYTGAGHLKSTSWVGDYSGELPICNNDVRPDDSVVVTFFIADDGRVLNALPIYASRPGQLGAVFAKTVSQWRWDQQSLKGVDPFWRSTLQLELRCITRPRPEQLSAATTRDADQWLAKYHLSDDYPVRSDDPRLTMPGGAVLAALAGPLPARESDIEALWKRLDQEATAPASAYALLIDRWALNQPASSPKQAGRKKAAIFAHWIAIFQQRFPDAPSLEWLRLEEALALEDNGDFAAAQPILQSILQSSANGDLVDDSLKRVALLHRAIGLDRAGDAVAAKDTLARSGLNGGQCSLFDTHPIPTSLQIGSEHFPYEAQRWRFEGYVKAAFDINADGSVKNVRAALAYPPYIFEQSTKDGVQNFKFVPPRLGGQVVGCDGMMEGVRYTLAK